jgi:hypothetical protein
MCENVNETTWIRDTNIDRLWTDGLEYGTIIIKRHCLSKTFTVI